MRHIVREVPFYDATKRGARKSTAPDADLKRAGVSGRQRRKFLQAARKAVKAAVKAARKAVKAAARAES
jgi:hypothetical protein